MTARSSSSTTSKQPTSGSHLAGCNLVAWDHCLGFQINYFPGVPIDIPVRWSGFLERGRPRPLNPPFMQTPVLEFGFKVEASASTQLDFGVEYSGFRVPLAVPAVPVQTKGTILNNSGRPNALIFCAKLSK